jgi:porphobilinogen synthase
MHSVPVHPILRPRRLRRTPNLRRLIRETTLSPADLIYPLFVRPGTGIRQPIHSMPGQYQWSVDQLPQEAEALAKAGLPAVILLAYPRRKIPPAATTTIPRASSARPSRPSRMPFRNWWSFRTCASASTPTTAIVASSIRRITVITIRVCRKVYLLNDPTLELLGKASVVHAQAGADIIAPSGMIDGMVKGTGLPWTAAGLTTWPS